MDLPKSNLVNWCRDAIKLCGEMSTILFPFKKEIAEIETSIKKVLKELESEDLVSIALLGRTGAGKSSLINSLLGGNFLPWSNEESCTATLTRVRFHDPKLITLLTTPFLENIKLELDEQAEDDDLSQNSRKKKNIQPKSKSDIDKLKAVYGKEKYESFCKNRNLNSGNPYRSVANPFSDAV